MNSDEEFIEANPNFEDQLQESDNDEEIDYKHKSLIEKITDLNVPDKVKRKRIRTEPRDIHELNLIKQDEDKLDLLQLADKIEDSKNNDIVKSIRKFTKKINRKKVLDVPLEKVQKNRLERGVLFSEASKEISKWEPIVLQNRVADQLSFPLKEPELKLENNSEIAKKFKPKSDFEKEIHELLTSSENYLNDEQPLTESEERTLRAMSLEEAKSKHKELRRERALLSYQEAKLNRQNKIKSKSYRKLKKREKLKKTIKEFEELKKTDPSKALEKLQELEKIRIKERTTLKHLNTGKWAKFNKLRSKNDEETRQKLSEQVDLNKQLVQKLFELTDDELSEEEEEEKDNNWELKEKEKVNSILSKDINEFHSNNELNQLNQDDELIFKQNYDNLIEKMNVEELEEMMKNKKKENRIKKKKIKDDELLKSKVTEIEEEDEEEEDSDLESNQSELDENNYRKLISEALAEDDAVEEFSKEKRDIENEEKGKIEDNFLPGWGNWAGDGIKISKKRKNKFIKKAPEVIRKDRDHSNVIISEKKDDLLNKFLPKTLPPGVKDSRSYQKKLNKPVGSNWNPETVFKNLTEPKIITKRGKIIEPMDSDALMNVRKFTDRKDFKSKLSQLIKLD